MALPARLTCLRPKCPCLIGISISIKYNVHNSLQDVLVHMKFVVFRISILCIDDCESVTIVMSVLSCQRLKAHNNAASSALSMVLIGPGLLRRILMRTAAPSLQLQTPAPALWATFL